MKNEMYVRYPKGASEQKLSKRLDLYWDREIQDWDLIVTDVSKLDEFLSVYKEELKSDDDKFTLMGLIVSTFDDYIVQKDSDFEKRWNECKIILEKEVFLHYSIIIYWSCLEEFNKENTFSITPYIKEVWERVKFNLE